MPTHKKTARSPSRTSRALTRELTATGRQLNETNADFLRIDVDTALTFAGLALETGDDAKRQRNRRNARKAYDTILRLSEKVTFSSSQEEYMREHMDQLKSDLSRLGETFPR